MYPTHWHILFQWSHGRVVLDSFVVVELEECWYGLRQLVWVRFQSLRSVGSGDDDYVLVWILLCLLLEMIVAVVAAMMNYHFVSTIHGNRHE